MGEGKKALGFCWWVCSSLMMYILYELYQTNYEIEKMEYLVGNLPFFWPSIKFARVPLLQVKYQTNDFHLSNSTPGLDFIYRRCKTQGKVAFCISYQIQSTDSSNLRRILAISNFQYLFKKKYWSDIKWGCLHWTMKKKEVKWRIFGVESLKVTIEKRKNSTILRVV